MKVKELIDRLSELPENLDILVSSGEYLDSATNIDEICKLWIDEEGNCFLCEDVHQEPNAIGIYGLI